MCGWLPGGKSITQKRVPPAGGGVPTMRAPMSSAFSPMPMSAGFRSVIHISVDRASVPLWLVARPSIRTLATLLASWPVTTRRTGGGRFGKSVAMVVRSPGILLGSLGRRAGDVHHALEIALEEAAHVVFEDRHCEI